MEKSKNQILSELYCIKAGLSAISIEKDKVSAEEKKLNKLCKTITSENDDILKLENSIKTVEANLKTYQSNTYVACEKPKFSQQILSGLWGALAGAALSPVAVIVGSFLIGFIAAAIGADTSASFAFMEHSVIFLYGLIICTILGVPVGMAISYNDELKKYNKDEQKRKTIETANNYNIQTNKRTLKGYENELATSNLSLNKNVNTYKDNLVVYESVKNLSVSTSETLYSALVSQFNATLDCRDWKHIDLIIFYYETGRADTLKECLQQVDRQVQTDAIIKEIRSASKNISDTIKTSITGLKEEMVVCFDKLSVQLDSQHKETMKKLTSIDKGISRVNEGIDSLNSTIKDGNAIMGELSKNMSKISEATYLQNALLEKISVDSMSLVKDTHYMIDYKTPETIVKFKIPTRAENKESVKKSKTVS